MVREINIPRWPNPYIRRKDNGDVFDWNCRKPPVDRNEDIRRIVVSRTFLAFEFEVAVCCWQCQTSKRVIALPKAGMSIESIDVDQLIDVFPDADIHKRMPGKEYFDI